MVFRAIDTTLNVAILVRSRFALLPRFPSPGDTVNVPVTLTNTTSNASTITATIATEGPVKVVGGNSQTIKSAAKGENSAGFRIVADPSINLAKVTVTVSGMGEKFVDVTDIAVRPPSTLQKTSGSGTVNGGSNQKITIGLGDFMPTSVNYSLVVSRSPALELGEQLRYLVQYPYGCTEQTVLVAFPVCTMVICRT